MHDGDQGSEDQEHSSLRGTMVAVLFLALVIIVSWAGMYAVLASRR